VVPDALPTPAQAQGRTQDAPRIGAQREGDGSMNTRLRIRPCTDLARFS
jgi:hypothetical protein